nr:pH-response regulator protein palA/rim20 [Polyrhizophydium stewartii]
MATHSFSELFTAPHPASLPFNNCPERTEGAGEASTFLGLPTKRNARPVTVKPPPSKAETAAASFMAMLMQAPRRALGPRSQEAQSLARTQSPQRTASPARPHAAPAALGAEAGGGVDIEMRRPVSPTRSGPRSPQRNQQEQQLPQQQEEYAFLDFQRELLPHLLASLPPSAAAAIAQRGSDQRDQEQRAPSPYSVGEEHDIRLEDYYPAESSPHPLAALLPSDSQWYALNQMRIHAGLPERSTSGIDKLAQYYAQLLHLEDKFPFETGKVDIEFSWFEAFAPEKQGNTLFNIAAIYSQLGSQGRLWTADGKKQAAANFQKAAGVLSYIRDSLTQRFKTKVDKTADLSETTLTALVALMLAQAAECFYHKACDEKSSSSVMALVAVYTSDLYDVTYRHSKVGTNLLRQRFPRKWICTIKAKTVFFGAIAHFHTGPSVSSERVVAERIARIGVARDLVTEALKYALDVGGILRDNRFVDTIQNALLLVEAANHHEIHETPFDVRLLAPLKRPPQALVNPSPFQEAVPDLAKYADVIHVLIAPNHREDVKAVIEESRNAALSGQTKLYALVKSIDDEMAKIGLPLPHPAQSNIADPGAGVQSHEELRAQSHALLKRMREYQSDEKTLSSGELVSNLDRLHQFMALNIQESRMHLDNIDLLRVPSDPALMLRIGELQSEVLQQENELRQLRAVYAEIKAAHESDVVQFGGTEWTEEKLSALVPVLLESGGTADTTAVVDERNTKMAAQFDAVVAKRDADIQHIEDLRRASQLMIVRLRSLPSETWMQGAGVKISDALAKQRQRLVDTAREIEKIQADKEFTVQSITELTVMMRALAKHFHDEREQARIVASFNETLDKCGAFRAKAQNEILTSIVLREETAKTLVKVLKLVTPAHGHDLKAGMDPTSEPLGRQRLPAHPNGVERDPLVFKSWNEFKPLVDIPLHQDASAAAEEQPPTTLPLASKHSPHRRRRSDSISPTRRAKSGPAETRRRLVMADVIDLSPSAPPHELSVGGAEWSQLHARAVQHLTAAQAALEAFERLQPTKPVEPSIPQANALEAQILAATSGLADPNTDTTPRRPSRASNLRRVSISERLPGGFPAEQHSEQRAEPGPSDTQQPPSTGVLETFRTSLLRMINIRKDGPAAVAESSVQETQQPTATHRNPFRELASRRTSYATAYEMQTHVSGQTLQPPEHVHPGSRRASSTAAPQILVCDSTGSVVEHTDSEIAANASGEPSDRGSDTQDMERTGAGVQALIDELVTGADETQLLSDPNYMIARLMKENSRLRGQFVKIRKESTAAAAAAVAAAVTATGPVPGPQPVVEGADKLDVEQVIGIIKRQDERIKFLERKVRPELSTQEPSRGRRTAERAMRSASQPRLSDTLDAQHSIAGPKPQASQSRRPRGKPSQQQQSEAIESDKEIMERYIRDQKQLADDYTSPESFSSITSSSDDAFHDADDMAAGGGSSSQQWTRRVSFISNAGGQQQQQQQQQSGGTSNTQQRGYSASNDAPISANRHPASSTRNRTRKHSLTLAETGHNREQLVTTSRIALVPAIDITVTAKNIDRVQTAARPPRMLHRRNSAGASGAIPRKLVPTVEQTASLDAAAKLSARLAGLTVQKQPAGMPIDLQAAPLRQDSGLGPSRGPSFTESNAYAPTADIFKARSALDAKQAEARVLGASSINMAMMKLENDSMAKAIGSLQDSH